MKSINKILIIILFIGFWGCRKDYTQENFMKLSVEVTNTYSDKVTLKITGNYKSLPIEFGVCYSEDEEEPNIDNSKIAKFDSDSYVISNLQPQTTYYWRTFVKDLKRNEIIYGKVQTFFTEEGGDTPIGDVIETWEIGYPNAKDVIAQLYSDGTLMISGTGAMKDFEEYNTTPWWSYRTQLKKLIIKNGVTSIGNNAFNSTDFTGNLIIPNSVITIGISAFSSCSGLTGLAIGNSVTTIGNSAFICCNGFTGNLTIPNSVTTIGISAFMHCSGFTGDLTIGNSVTNIGIFAFEYCSGFNGNLIIGNSVTTIEKYAFGGCSGLNSVTVNAIIPPKLGTGVFSEVPTTIPIYVPCASLTAYQTANGWNYFTNYQCTTTSNDAKLANLSVSAGTLTPAFSSTTYNYNVNVANTVTSITITATTNHSQATVSGSGTKNLSVGENTFTITVTAEDGTTKLNYNVIVTRAGTTVIDQGYCGKIANTLPWVLYSDGTLTISGSGAMADYNDYNMPWFSYKSQITKLIINNGVTTIGNCAFSGCGYCCNLIIPNSVTSIGIAAFGEGCFIGDLIIPNSVTFIGDNAFWLSGFSFGNLIIGNSVTYIGEAAFYKCDFTNLTIPNSVTTIVNDAFGDCYYLTDIKVSWTTPILINYDVFRYITLSNIKLHVPVGTKSAYQSAPVWQEFNIVEY